MNNLTVVTAGTAIGAPADARKAIIANLTVLELAFSDGRKLDQAQSDMRVALWQEALDGLSPAVAVFVTRRMRLFNPRNPFAPTPQDLFELAQATVKVLRNAVRLWVIEERWSPSGCQYQFKYGLPEGWFPETLAAPFEPGCIVDDDDAATWVGQALLGKVLNRDKLLSPTATRSEWECLARTATRYDWEGLARLELPTWRKMAARLPARALTSETREIIAVLDTEHAKRRAIQLADDADRSARSRAAALRELQEYDANIARKEGFGEYVPPRERQELDKAQLRRAAGLERDLYPDGDA